MIKVKCVDRIKDKNGNVVDYLLEDKNKKRKEMKAKDLKEAIKNKKIEVVNLTLTDDNRLIVKEEKEEIKKVVKKETKKEEKKETNLKDIKKTITEQIIQGLESAGSWRKLWECCKEFYNPYTIREYSFLNSTSIFGQMNSRQKQNDEKTFMTFYEIKNIGAQLVKGAKSYNVYYYMPCYKDVETNEFISQKKYESIIEKDKKTEKKKPSAIKFFCLRTYYVFSTSDIIFKDEEQKQKYSQIRLTKHKYTRKDIDKILNTYFDKENIEVHNDKISNVAYYDKDLHSITIPKKEQFTQIDEYYNTLFHECVRSTRQALKRKVVDEDKTSKSVERLIGEIGAMMLCERFGINEDNKTNSIAYIKEWVDYLHEHDDIIVSASKQSEKAVKYILGE